MTDDMSEKIASECLGVTSNPASIVKSFPQLSAADVFRRGLLIAGHNHDNLLAA
ncbi:hypothetical protein [Ruegeria sp. HKCCD7255]|uniref:hypothetical protein n=1 Tax=Ruegeria sp. HKCCD7255 TaxID=2683004 RepID=UPI0014893162|nr:hypothetical protein [Ruegeria sp. HKCCD7255]